MKEKVMISACLLGKNCRFDGGHSHIKELDVLEVDWVPVCPEEEGGLGTPRPAAEMQGNAEEILNGVGNVVTNEGYNVTEKFILGAENSLKKGLNSDAKYAILKSRSSSCGVGIVYDGTFTHSLIEGEGILAYLCRQKEINCISSDENPDKIKKTLQKLK